MKVNYSLLIMLLCHVQWMRAISKIVTIEDNYPGNQEIKNLNELFAQTSIGKHNSNIQYSILDKERDKHFKIVKHSVYTKKAIDLDTMCNEVNECCDRDQTLCEFDLDIGSVNGQSVFTETLKIQIRDINDHSPQFKDFSNRYKINSQGQLQLDIREDSKPGMLINLPLASDADFGKHRVTRYEIQDESSEKYSSSYFTLKVGPGEPPQSLQLQLLKQMDREKIASVTFNVLAIDGGDNSGTRTGSLSVLVTVIDVNDNLPYFTRTHYSASVQENLVPTQPLISLEVEDKDIGINTKNFFDFQLNVAFIRQHFRIDSNQAKIYLIKALDYERDPSIQFTVTVSNTESLVNTDHFAQVRQQSQSTATVQITVENIQDEQLDISVNYMKGRRFNYSTIMENTLDSFVALVTVKTKEISLMANNIHCEINKPFDKYLIVSSKISDRRKHSYEVRLITPLDREKTPEINTKIFCSSIYNNKISSRHWKPIRIVVLDENDNSPQIIYPSASVTQGHTITMKENAEVGHKLLCVKAVDPDSGDNGKLQYNLDKSDPRVLTHFSIDANNGCIILRHTIDRETMPMEYKGHMLLKITVQDFGRPQSRYNETLVKIYVEDVNDNRPNFINNPMYFSIRENQPKNTIIGKIEVTDGDVDDRITLRLIGQSIGKFHLSPVLPSSLDARFSSPYESMPSNHNHLFLLNTSTSLDCEKQSKYQFTVLAIDGLGKLPSNGRLITGVTHTATATIEIEVLDLNDNAPQFIKPSPNNHSVYRVSYKEPAAHKIVQISALDADHSADNSKLLFSIDSTPPTTPYALELFDINPASRYLQTRRDMNLNDIKEYTLLLVVCDNGYPLLCNKVLVTIIIDKSHPLSSVPYDIYNNHQPINNNNNYNNNNKMFTTTSSNDNQYLIIFVVVAIFCLFIAVAFAVYYLMKKCCPQNKCFLCIKNFVCGCKDSSNTNSHDDPNYNTHLTKKGEFITQSPPSVINNVNAFYSDRTLFSNQPCMNPTMDQHLLKQNHKYMTTMVNPYDPQGHYTGLNQSRVRNNDSHNESKDSYKQLTAHHNILQNNQIPLDHYTIGPMPIMNNSNNINNSYMMNQHGDQISHQQRPLLNFHRSENNLNLHGGKQSLLLFDQDPNDDQEFNQINLDQDMCELDMNNLWQNSSSQTPMPIRSKSVMNNRPKNHTKSNDSNNKFAVNYPQDESTFV